MPSVILPPPRGDGDPPYALDVRNASKTFGAQRVLSEVDLQVRPGEVRALAGENGSGKSTLVKLLAGYHEPDPGTAISVAGHPLASHNPAASESAGLRFVHQDLALVDRMSTVENLGLGYRYGTRLARPVRWRERRSRARDAMTRLGYGTIDVTAPVGSLAASERTAVAVARSLATDRAAAHVLVLDEPTANLPGPEVKRLFDLVRTVQSDGIAVLFISHHLTEIFEIAETVTVLRGGQLVGTRQVAGVSEDALIEMMLGHKVGKARPVSASNAGRITLAAKEIANESVRAFELTASAGQIVGVAGITGSGREAVGELLFGAKQRRGTVTVDGQAIPRNRPDLSIAAGVGFVPANRQKQALFTKHNVSENISLARPADFVRNGRFRRTLETQACAQWLDRLDVRPKQPQNPVVRLSGGNAQKVVIARWLRLAPKVLILDEPTQGVDVGAREDIHCLIDDAASRGCTVVVCSSDSEELARLCSRVLVMVRGRVEIELSGPLQPDDVTAACLTDKSGESR